MFILPIQIGRLQVNAWVSFASVSCIWYWFHSLIFRFVHFNVHQKREFEFLFSLCSQMYLLNKASFAANTQKINSKWRCPIFVSLVCVKRISLRINFLCVLENTIPRKTLQFVNIKTVLCFYFFTDKRFFLSCFCVI